MKRLALAALALTLMLPASATLAGGRDRGARYSHGGGRHYYDRGDRHDRGQRSHRSRSSFSFSFGVGSHWDGGYNSFNYTYGRPYYRPYRERVVIVEPAPVYVAPPPVIYAPPPRVYYHEPVYTPRYYYRSSYYYCR